MLYRKLVSVFLLIFLVGNIAIAEDKKPEFTTLNPGDKAPFYGFLFTPEAITKIYVTTEEEKKRAELEHNSEVSLLNLEIQRVTELKIIEIAVKNKLITDVTNNKNKEIELREKIIRDFQEEREANKFFIAGSFLAGIVLTGTIVYFVSGITK